MKSIIRQIIFKIFLTLMLTACASAPTATSADAPTGAINLTPLSTEKNTTLPTVAQTFLNIRNLKQGLYIAYGEVTPDKVYLSVMSWEGGYQGKVAELIGGYGSDLSPDKHFLTDLPYIIDLDSGNRILYDELENCTYPDWSPDSKKLAVSCPTDNFHHNDIYIFSVQDRSKVPVTDCEFDAFICSVPLWSPDGHWLAFGRGLGRNGTSKLVGLHILDMTCSSGLANCWDDEEGIYIPADFSWSPNAEFLAAVDKDKVFIFQIKDGRLNLAETYKIEGILAQVAWLGNNNKLLVLDSKGAGGYVILRQLGLVLPLAEAQNSFFKSHSGAFDFIFAIP